MAEGVRRCRYVGPAEVLAAVRADTVGQVIRTREGLAAWLGERGRAELGEPFTFVVDLEGDLRLAPRRSEHVACAGGEPVLSAGEILFAEGPTGWAVEEASNQSTGYCPEGGSWPAVGAALDRAGVPHPGRFTVEIVFRRCPRCGERNVVRDDHFFCAICEGELPERWNFDAGSP
ncbi:hypothetical protein [Nonomuraea sp. NPDC005650]|uniref:hypothetical protein n=1 Tax=Nonomuraea sp. NPDC005650 TaxID=3157045 RepID=UPI0033B2F2E2